MYPILSVPRMPDVRQPIEKAVFQPRRYTPYFPLTDYTGKQAIFIPASQAIGPHIGDSRTRSRALRDFSAMVDVKIRDPMVTALPAVVPIISYNGHGPVVTDVTGCLIRLKANGFLTQPDPRIHEIEQLLIGTGFLGDTRGSFAGSAYVFTNTHPLWDHGRMRLL